jgi:uridine kinase
MLARRIKRDISERGRDVDGVIDQYLRFVKDSYDNFVLPSARHADIVSRRRKALDLACLIS